jgi:hypothetical protein
LFKTRRVCRLRGTVGTLLSLIVDGWEKESQPTQNESCNVHLAPKGAGANAAAAGKAHIKVAMTFMITNNALNELQLTSLQATESRQSSSKDFTSVSRKTRAGMVVASFCVVRFEVEGANSERYAGIL